MKTPAERHLELSWELLEHKCRYYILCETKVDDYIYDALEREYAQLCLDLGLPDTISTMVDFDTKRPSCKLVMDKLGAFAPIGKAKPKESWSEL